MLFHLIVMKIIKQILINKVPNGLNKMKIYLKKVNKIKIKIMNMAIWHKTKKNSKIHYQKLLHSSQNYAIGIQKQKNYKNHHMNKNTLKDKIYHNRKI